MATASSCHRQGAWPARIRSAIAETVRHRRDCPPSPRQAPSTAPPPPPSAPPPPPRRSAIAETSRP